MFKTGDKGKTRGGDYYSVITVIDVAPLNVRRFVIAMINDERADVFYENGMRADEKNNAKCHDLIPPKQKIEGHLNVFHNGDIIFSQALYPLTQPGKLAAVVPISIPYTEGDGL